MNNNEIHAHVQTQSRDCDSTYSRTLVERMNDDERNARGDQFGVTNEGFSDLEFMNRVFTSYAGPYAVSIGMEVKVNESGFEANESTEEGYRWAEVRWCTDECDDKSTFRDHAAEQAGY